MISRRSLLSQAGLLAAGGAGLRWLREKVLWPPPRARFADGATGSGWLPWAPPQGVIIVPVAVDGLTVDALVDSGAQASVMDAGLFDRLGPGRAMPLPVVAFGLTGRPQLGRSTRCDVAIGQLSLEGVAAAVLDLSPLAQAAGRPISLVLGMNALGATLVELDFRRRRLAFHARDHAPAAPAGLDWVSLPARLEGRELLVWAEVEGKAVEVALDTGASAALSLSEDRAQALGLLDGRPTGATPTVTLGGASLSRTVRVSSLSFAGRTRRDATVHIYPRPAHGGGLPPGLLGGEALAGLRVLADLGEGGLRVLPAPEPPALPRTRRRAI